MISNSLSYLASKDTLKSSGISYLKETEPSRAAPEVGHPNGPCLKIILHPLLMYTDFFLLLFSIQSLDNSINKAATYLSRKYGTLQRPYTTALTAYALALAGHLNDERVLMAASTGKVHLYQSTGW